MADQEAEKMDQNGNDGKATSEEEKKNGGSGTVIRESSVEIEFQAWSTPLGGPCAFPPEVT